MGTQEQSIHKYLVERSKKGDRQAQNELYKLYAGAMYNICKRMMGDEDEAKDLLQDSFINAFTKLDKLQNNEIFGGWLKRIVVNNCLNKLKRKSKFEAQLSEDFDVVDETIPQDLSLENEDVSRVMKAIDQISAGCRTVFNLYLFEGYDHKEIGEILSITESASKAQLARPKVK